MGRPTFLLLLPLAFLLLLLLLLLSTNQSGKKDVPRVFVARMANSPILVYNKVSAAFLRFNRRAGEQVRLFHPPAADEEVEGGEQVCFVFIFFTRFVLLQVELSLGQ